MDSNSPETLEQINHKLQLIIENSYLARLDLMFSVLLSLTIFLVGSAINQALAVQGFFPIYLGSIIVIFAWTLIGECWAILTNNVIMRFKFWMSLLFSVSILVFFLPLSLLPSRFEPELISFSLIYVFFFSFTSRVHKLFNKYVGKFPSRFPQQKFPIKEWGTLLTPSLIGLILFTLTYLILYGHFYVGAF